MDLNTAKPGIIKKYDEDTLPQKEKIFSSHARRKRRNTITGTHKIKSNDPKKRLLLKEITIPYTDPADFSEESCIIRMYHKATQTLNPEKSLMGIFYTLADNYTDKNPWRSSLQLVYFKPPLNNGFDWYKKSIQDKKKLLLSNEYVQNKLTEIEIYNAKLLSWESPESVKHRKTIPLIIHRENISKKSYDISIKTIQIEYSGQSKSYLEAKATSAENPFKAYKSYEEIPSIIHKDKEYLEAINSVERAHALIGKYCIETIAEQLMQKTITQIREQYMNR